MFTLEVRASWFPEGRSPHQLVAAPKQIPSGELAPVPPPLSGEGLWILGHSAPPQEHTLQSEGAKKKH